MRPVRIVTASVVEHVGIVLPVWSNARMVKRTASPPKLTQRGRQVVALVVNAVAFKTHGDDAEVETLAGELGTTGPRLRPMLRRLADQGWITVEGKLAEFVYPTVTALRWVDPK